MCHDIFNFEKKEFQNGIWPLIDKYNIFLQKFINISKGEYNTVFEIFNEFSKYKLFCPFLTTTDSCKCNINKKVVYSNEYVHLYALLQVEKYVQEILI